MSGLSTGAVLAGRIDLAGSLLQGVFGAPLLTLGTFGFQGFEIPGRIPFGGEQELRTKKLPGGQRVIDLMGEDPCQIRWEGRFLSTDAVSRALTLDGMRKAGGLVSLSWDSLYFSVVIDHFEANYESPGNVPYRISCTVLQDLSTQTPASLLSAAVQIASDINGAIGYVSGLLIRPEGHSVPTLTAAQTANVNATLAFTQAAAQQAATVNYQLGSASYALAVATMQSAQTATQTALDGAGAVMEGLALSAQNGIAETAAALTEAYGVAATLAAISATRGYVNRANVNTSTGAT